MAGSAKKERRSHGGPISLSRRDLESGYTSYEGNNIVPEEGSCRGLFRSVSEFIRDRRSAVGKSREKHGVPLL